MSRVNPLVFAMISLLVFCSTPLAAFEVLVLDQNGKPVKDAYVAIPEGNIEQAEETPAIMDQLDIAFVPHVLAIDQGQAVVFPNSDNIRHHVYSFSQPKKFEIKLYQGVPEQPITFNQPGLVALGCNIHDSMLGYIYVSPWPNYGVSDESGKLTFSQTAEELLIWHPRLEGKAGLVRKAIDSKHETVTITLKLKKEKTRRQFRAYRRDRDDY
ncbi:hypothetical protein A3752_04500 [Oleiphilus sp. HI0081]|nr:MULTISPECIES: methylamine utilization protein [unclassified Oleiphilus]KZY78999.1 hypothetical protein A3741_07690 [Oleiphilus sp. HI0069]KZY83818.1 hypothetical protein A3740_05115 [Oleiphilus sp. HI0068]KZY86983.1 hypothetical protein A3743_15695 [Oleiphilus sp. HI0072]KZZ07598.1 hypothetical protein A3749_02150 [Oleiphilus sp. HI0078]KZZ27075.1 hypothetical protein A3752_04500 [Oleiphilus sp. HI0081]